MKSLALFLASTLFLAACTENSGDASSANAGDTTAPNVTMLNGGDENDQAFIITDTANKMIESYLTSIDAPGNDTDLRSLIINANALRAYLTDTEAGRKITTMKLMFAHTQNYINSGGSGKNCGYKSGALTVVLAGIDSAGNYVLYPGKQVLDNSIPCPASCPSAGDAANDLLPQQEL